MNDSQLRELRLGSHLVKQFKVPAPNQQIVLTVFEEEGWPVRIDDPLPRHPEVDAKRRLHDTIHALNRHQKTLLLRFLGDGTGEGVRWTFVGAAKLVSCEKVQTIEHRRQDKFRKVT